MRPAPLTRPAGRPSLADEFDSVAAENADAGPRAGKTLLVLLMLVLAAATFSYLSAYAVSDALVSADVLKPPSAGPDPRPRWMAVTFAGVMGAFLAVGLTARLASGRQLRRIDAMTDDGAV